jgi:hypothetical protein
MPLELADNLLKEACRRRAVWVPSQLSAAIFGSIVLLVLVLKDEP